MKVINLIDDSVEMKEPISIALGYFDGLHLAHQEVINEAVAYSKKNKIKNAVLTFSPNPNVILKKLSCDRLLTPINQKIKLLSQLEVDYLIVLPFNEQLANMPAESFVNEYLIKLGVKHVVTGFDYRFGRMGEGDAQYLKKFPEFFSVSIVEKRELVFEKIGATQIKGYLSEGEMDKVIAMLGRPYQISGKVVAGKQRGREIGFPTANIALNESYIIPKKGVYAVKVTIDERDYIGMCNIGHNPTFNFNDEISIEVNVLEFEGDLYGKILKLDFLGYIREEQKFNSIKELMMQLSNDQKQINTNFKIYLK